MWHSNENIHPALRPYEDVFYCAATAIFRGPCRDQVLDSAERPFRALERAPTFLQYMFMAIERRPATPDRYKSMQGYRDSAGMPWWYSRWAHRARSQIQEDVNELRIDISTLRSSLASYLQCPEFRTDYLDWYFADTITYAEFFATYYVFSTRRHPLTAWLVRAGGTQRAAGLALRLLGFAVTWVAWATLAFLTATFFGKLGLACFVAITATYLALQFRRHRSAEQLLVAMRAAYDVFETQTFSWEVAWAELNKSRELGAVWPGELYRLVELRRGTPLP